MAERRAVVIRIAGDAEIGDALAEGIRRGTGDTSSVTASPCHLPLKGKAEGETDPAKLEADRIAEEWVDWQRLRRTVGNRKTAEDYELLIVKAEGDYGRKRIGPLARRLWAVVGMVVLAGTCFFAWEEARWRGL